MTWLENSTIHALSGALGGLGARTQAIASNLSNIDTPGYAPVSVEFESELSRQLADAGLTVNGDGSTSWGGFAESAARGAEVAPVRLARTAPGHLAAPDAPLSAGVVESRGLDSFRNDANAVDVDASMTSLAETQLKYGATARLLGGQMAMLRDVITSQGGR
jgi:flagellar basal body rod protein FlgB